MKATTGPGARGRLVVLATGLVTVALLVTACGGSAVSSSAPATPAASSGGGDTGASGTLIKIGALSTLDGTFAGLGEPSMQGVKMALLEYGGKLDGTGVRDGVSGASVGGHPIELVIESSDATADVAVAKAKKLVEQDNVDILVGPLSGDEGIAIKNYAKSQLGKTFINGLAAAQNATLRDPSPNVYRFGGDGAMWMAGLGKYAHDVLGYDTVATVAEDYSYPYDQVGGFLTEFCAAGGKVAERVWFPLGTKDLSTYVTQLPKDVDAVMFAMGGTDAINFVKQYDQFTGKVTPLLGGTTAVDGSVLEGLGTRADGIVSAGPTPVLDTAEYKKFADDLGKAFPGATPNIVSIYYYTGALAALKALEQVDGDLSDNQEAFQAALAKLEFTAPQGPVKLDANRQAVITNYITKIEGGQVIKVQDVGNVNATLGFPAADYVAQPAFDRENPACK
jgi:branched-chain amino acid transport system substrate-binding protein